MIQSDVQKNKGIALLMTVVISFIVIAIGLSLSSMALRELDISITVREGMRATYAADAGIECARYWSTRNANYFATDDDAVGSEFKKISCGGDDNINLDDDAGSPDVGEYTFNMFVNGDAQAQVDIRRVRDEDERTAQLVSYGYNTTSGDRQVTAFREYEISDSLSIDGGAKDIMMAIDASKSMGQDSRNPGVGPCDNSQERRLNCALLASEAFVEAIFEEVDSDRIIGVTSFSVRARCTDWQQFIPGDKCSPFGSPGGQWNVEAYERLDVPMVDNSDKDVLVGSGGLLTSRANFKGGSYGGTFGNGSNFHIATMLSLAELTGRRIRSAGETCPLNAAGDVVLDGQCPGEGDPGGPAFPQFDGLSGNGRDRPDEEYPDAYVLIGDFQVNEYTKDDWSNNSNVADSITALVGALQEMESEEIQIYLVLIGPKNDKAKDFFDALDLTGTEYNFYSRDNYSGLEDVLLNEVFGDLIGVSVVPIIEK